MSLRGPIGWVPASRNRSGRSSRACPVRLDGRPITPNPEKSRELFVDALGLSLEATEGEWTSGSSRDDATTMTVAHLGDQVSGRI
jgi:hypothetical protein